MGKKGLVISAWIGLSGFSAFAESAKDIMVQHDEKMRKSFTSYMDKVEMSTCKFSLRNGAMNCEDAPRVSLVNAVLKYGGKDPRDSKSAAIVEQPARDKGIGILNYDYYASDKLSDNWIYLPVLGKVKRIITSSGGLDEGGNFLGSEFTTEDMQVRKPEEWNYKLAADTVFEGKPAWLIESTPTLEKAARSNYSKILSYIDKGNFMYLKESYFDRKGELHKQRILTEYLKIDGIYAPKVVTMVNYANHRVSRAVQLSRKYNIKLDDEFFTPRAFTDDAYREQRLAAFQATRN
jgi:hypothetical protein